MVIILLLSLLGWLPNQPAKSLLPSEQDAARPSSECSQPEGERESLIREAVENEYWVRRVEFYGIPNTPDRVLRRRLVLAEGGIFTREDLVKSLERLSKLKRLIYPLKVSDVLIQLDRPGRNVDMVICFRERRQRRASRHGPVERAS